MFRVSYIIIQYTKRYTLYTLLRRESRMSYRGRGPPLSRCVWDCVCLCFYFYETQTQQSVFPVFGEAEKPPLCFPARLGGPHSAPVGLSTRGVGGVGDGAMGWPRQARASEAGEPAKDQEESGPLGQFFACGKRHQACQEHGHW